MHPISRNIAIFAAKKIEIKNMRKLFFAATSLLFIIPCLANNGDEIPLSKDSLYEYDNRNEQSVPTEPDKYQAHLSSSNIVILQVVDQNENI